MTLYDLVKNALVDSKALEEILLLYEPKIKKSLYLTNPNDREDLSQELKIKIIQNALDYDIDSIPGFWQMREKINNEKKLG